MVCVRLRGLLADKPGIPLAKGNQGATDAGNISSDDEASAGEPFPEDADIPDWRAAYEEDLRNGTTQLLRRGAECSLRSG